MTAPKRETDRDLLDIAIAQLQELHRIIARRESGDGDQYAVATRGMAIIDNVSQQLDVLLNEFDLSCQDLEQGNDSVACAPNKAYAKVLSLPSGAYASVDTMTNSNGTAILACYHGSADELLDAGIITAAMLEYADSKGGLLELSEDQLPLDEFGTPTEIFRSGKRVYVCKVIQSDSDAALHWEGEAGQTFESVDIERILARAQQRRE